MIQSSKLAKIWNVANHFNDYRNYNIKLKVSSKNVILTLYVAKNELLQL